MNDSLDPVFLKYFDLRREAEHARDILRQHGIKVLLQAVKPSEAYGVIIEGPTEMHVMPEDKNRAEEVLAAYLGPI